MPLLFSYGSLLHEHVQLATFGRVLAGSAETLPGFQRISIAITDSARAAQLDAAHLTNVVRSESADSGVVGMLFEISDAELAVADEYERRDAYRRVPATFASGRAGWLYVATP